MKQDIIKEREERERGLKRRIKEKEKESKIKKYDNNIDYV